MQFPVEAKLRQTFSLGCEEGFEEDLGGPRPPRPERDRPEKEDMMWLVDFCVFERAGRTGKSETQRK